MAIKISKDESLKLAFTALYMLSDNALLNFVEFDDDGTNAKHYANVAITFKLLEEFVEFGDNVQWGLELIHLSDISNEDLIAVTKIVRPDMLDYMPDKDGNHKKGLIEWFSNKTTYGMHHPWYLLTKAEHFLRGRGYAVAWNGLTVEDQYRLGWVRFKKPEK